MWGILFNEMQEITNCQRNGCILPNQAMLAAILRHGHQKRKELSRKAAPSLSKILPGRAVTISWSYMPR